MNAVLAFVIVMAVWTVSDWVAKKTQSLLSSLFVASIIFFIGFLTDIFPDDLLASSSLLGLGGVVVGFIIVHLGTLISIDEFKRQWKTLVVGMSAPSSASVSCCGSPASSSAAADVRAPTTASPRRWTTWWPASARSAAAPSRC